MTTDDMYLIANALRPLTPDAEGATVGEQQLWGKISAALLQLGRRHAAGFDPITFVTWLKPEDRPGETQAPVVVARAARIRFVSAVEDVQASTSEQAAQPPTWVPAPEQPTEGGQATSSAGESVSQNLSQVVSRWHR